MAKPRKKIELENVEIDMTPMIDVVFNLLIFFMLVNQMVQIERAELELPVASQAEEEASPDKKRLIVNIHKDGSWEVAGRKIQWPELQQILYDEAKQSTDSEGRSTRSVLIRADIDTQYRDVQRVMRECANKKLYKISFGAKLSEEL